MGVTSSRPAEEHDEAAVYDEIFFSTASAAPTSLEKPWGADNITIDDVAWHVAIALSVIRAAGTPESELVEQALGPAHAFDAVLLSRLRSELGFGDTMLLVDVNFHVRRLLQTADYYSNHIALSRFKSLTLFSMKRFVGAAAQLPKQLPMLFIQQHPLHGLTIAYLHGLEIVRFTRIPGSATLSLHSGPGTVSTPGAINSVSADLFRGAGITVMIKGDQHEWRIRYKAAGNEMIEDYFYDGIEFVYPIPLAPSASVLEYGRRCLQSSQEVIILEPGRTLLGRDICGSSAHVFGGAWYGACDVEPLLGRWEGARLPFHIWIQGQECGGGGHRAGFCGV